MTAHTGDYACPACADRERSICGFLLALLNGDDAGAHSLVRPYLDNPYEAYGFIRRLAELGLGWIELWVAESDTGLDARHFLADVAQMFAGGGA